jgi:hypothetical protein
VEQVKRILLPALVVLAAFALARGAAADTPFPAVHSGDVFVIAQTVTTDGSMHDYYKPGDTVVFRAYAVDGKNHKVLTEAKYFYATIPGQPNVKFKYDPKAKTALGQYAWIGTWTVPSTYQLGLVNFKVLVQAKTKRRGSFVQMPVASSQLTITNTPPATGTTPPAAVSTPTGTSDLVVYADSVNGTRPAGAAPRPIGCTQTNVFKRGEQFVLRTWGFDLKSGALFSLDNVTEAHFTVPGQPNVTLNWGTHGAARVFFWTNFWNIPTTFPLGDISVKISYSLTTGKVATLDYPITIIP